MAFQEGGANALMASYNAWNGTPMAVNPVLRSVVLKQWGADIISSDGGAIARWSMRATRSPIRRLPWWRV